VNIGIVYHGGEFPPAERIEKQAKSLSREGHKVFLLCNNYGKFPTSRERIGDVEVIRLPPALPPSWRVFCKVLKFPIFANPLWVAHIFISSIRYKLDVIQVVDIPLSLAVLWIGRLLRLPIVFDMWENYPAALEGWAKHNWRTRIFKNPSFARFVERFSVRRFDKVFVVVEEQLERLVTLGVSRKIISVVSNGYDEELFIQGNISSSRTDQCGNFQLLYVGGVTVERGLQDVIPALKLLRDAGKSATLILAGDGEYMDELKELAISFEVVDCIKYLGWVPFHQISELIRNADLCLVPHVNNECINSTIPNKLFQYLAMGKPVLVSNATPLKRVIQEFDCGYVFESGSSNSFAKQVKSAIESPNTRKRFAENAPRAIQEKYKWEICAKPLLEYYNSLRPKL
jgi:glycosyltransferase involved in cell wall biosynthesis